MMKWQIPNHSVDNVTIKPNPYQFLSYFSQDTNIIQYSNFYNFISTADIATDKNNYFTQKKIVKLS